MRRTGTTRVVLAALVAALVAPAGLLASEGGIGGLAGDAARQAGLRGGESGVGRVLDRVPGDARERVEPIVTQIEDLTAQPEGRVRPPRKGGRKTTSAARAASASGSVEIKDFLYRPETITIDAGDSVTWINADSAPHDAKAFDGSFQTEVMNEGDSDSVSFSEAGTFTYFCSLHPPEQFPEFTGKVVVRDAGGGEPSPGAGDSGGAGPGGDSTGPDTPVSSDDAGAQAGTTAGGTGAAGQESGSGGGGGSALALTGLDLGQLALTGILLLALGACIRRLRTDA